MSIQKEISIRYKAEGHVRFEIPESLCDKDVAKRITARILEIDGVYRVDIFKKQKKLSIRYHEVVCEFKQLANQLYQILSEMDDDGSLLAPVVNEVSSAVSNLKSRFKG